MASLRRVYGAGEHITQCAHQKEESSSVYTV